MRARCDNRFPPRGAALLIVAAGIAVAMLGQRAVASGLTPLETATAGADLGLAFGLDALFANPAQLGINNGPTTQVRLLGIGGGLHSNGLGWSDYRRYNGAVLEEDDKDAILSRIPAGGCLLSAEGQVGALALRHGPWGLAIYGFGSAHGRLDREVLDLLFHGNTGRPDWLFERSDAEGMAAGKISLSHGRTVAHIAGGPLQIGLTLAYLRGLYYARADQVHADLSTQTTGLTGQAAADWLTAAGGSGWSLDIGTAWEPAAGWIASVAAENLVHTIHWNRDVQLKHYELLFDDLTVDNFDDSLWVSHETTEGHGAVDRGLPPTIRAGLARTVSRNLRVSTAATVSLAERFGATTRPQIAAGAEYMLWSTIPLRTGVALGGPTGFACGWGTGVRWGALAWDLSLRIDRGLWLGGGRGLTCAMAIDLN